MSAQKDVEIIRREIFDEINEFVGDISAFPYTIRSNAQTHFDDAVRLFTESLRVFSMNANQVYFPVADTNRSCFQECLINIRDSVDHVMEYLRKHANAPVFDFANATETRIEIDLKNQTEELKAAIKTKEDAQCLEKIGINVVSLNEKYLKYYSGLIGCIIPLSVSTHADIITKFSAPRMKAWALLNRIGMRLGNIRKRTQVESFVSLYEVIQ